VAFLEPYAGLVIRYSFLWKREHEAGREEGTKDRHGFLARDRREKSTRIKRTE
jgi:hypothetical protein